MQHGHEQSHATTDPWHDHSHDAVKPQQAHTEKVNGPLVIGVGTVLFVLIAATVVVTYMYYNWYVTRLHNRAIAADSTLRTDFMPDPNGRLDYAHRAERERIETLLDASSASVVVPQAGAPGQAFIQLPADVARQRVLEAYRENRNAPARESP